MFVKYHVTGTTKPLCGRLVGQRFRIVTKSAGHADGINLWLGSVWGVRADGTRKLLKRVFN